MPAVNGDISGIVASDEFNRKPGEPALPLQWQWNHNPDNSRWSLNARPGFLRLTTGSPETELASARNSLTQRTFGPQSAASTAIDVSHMKDGDMAGLSSFQKKYGFVGVKMEGQTKSIVMVSAASDTPQQIASVPLNQNNVWLRVECDFQNKTDKAYFSYSLDGKNWQRIGEPLQMVYTLPQFIGYRFALFNYATKDAGGYRRFRLFSRERPNQRNQLKLAIAHPKSDVRGVRGLRPLPIGVSKEKHRLEEGASPAVEINIQP